jgi:TonB family protein
MTMQFSKPGRKICLLAVLLLATPNSDLRAQTIKQLESWMKTKYVGRVLTLKHFSHKSSIRFLSDGTLDVPGDSPTWTLYSVVSVRNIRLSQERLRIETNRVYFFLDNPKKGFVPAQTNLGLRLDIENPRANDQESLDGIMARLFLLSGTTVPRSPLPPYWQAYFSHHQNPSPKPGEEYCNRVGGVPVKTDARPIGATVPEIIRKVDPEFPEGGRSRSPSPFRDTVAMHLIVQKDGTPRDIELSQPMGFGFDESAVNAVQQWQFRPGMQNGAPADVCAYLEVTFSY